MSLENLAIVFAPSLLRNPSEDPLELLQNTKFETRFTSLFLAYIARLPGPGPFADQFADPTYAAPTAPAAAAAANSTPIPAASVNAASSPEASTLSASAPAPATTSSLAVPAPSQPPRVPTPCSDAE